MRDYLNDCKKEMAGFPFFNHSESDNQSLWAQSNPVRD